MNKTNNGSPEILNKPIAVNSEIGQLLKVLVHSPDGGIGNVPTNKLHDWLYDDIVDLGKIQEEYERYQILLLLFLDTAVLFDDEGNFIMSREDHRIGKRYLQNNPGKPNYFVDEDQIHQSRVLDIQFLLQYLFKLHHEDAKELVVAICAFEGLHTCRRKDLLGLLEKGKEDNKYYVETVKTLLTGKLEYEVDPELQLLTGEDVRFIFPPIPNFIFTRDISVTVGDHILITKPKFYIRKREVMLMRFIAEHFFYPDKKDHHKIIDVSEDDEFFRDEVKDQDEKKVTYEGGDIMMVSNRHLLLGCSERTSPYAIQKLINRIFWEKINTGESDGVDIITVIKISAKRSQMHIDTILSHIREDAWVIHSSLSEEWQREQEEKEWYEKKYIDELVQKSENEIKKEQDVIIFQFFLNSEGKAIKKEYIDDPQTEEEKQHNKKLKGQFKKIDFMLRSKNGDTYFNAEENCPYTRPPKGLQDFLTQISILEFGAGDVKFIYSAGGDISHESREQWTDACNLLILKPGIGVGYDRNYKTAKAFNAKFKNEPVSENKAFIDFVVERNRQRFKLKEDELPLEHVLHVNDLTDFIIEHHLKLEETKTLIDSIKNTLVLLPSNELSRARGGSHCMSMPIIRKAR